MKNKLKGFTLVECLIALAILGVASLTMAQIYGGVAKVNKNNNEINTSISNQMKYVEKQTIDGGIVDIKFSNSDNVDPQLEKDTNGNYKSSADRKPPHQYTGDASNTGYTSFLKITEVGSGATYSYPIDVRVLKIRDRNDKYKGEAGFDNNYEAVGDGSTSSSAGTGPKYKYFVAH